jgi:cytochrome c-type biogenesis protein CcmE
MAVSIGAARLLLLYALAKKKLSVFYFHGCFYRGSKTSIAICFSKKKQVYFIFMAVSIGAARLLLLYALAKKT